jgi:hypothetical protein
MNQPGNQTSNVTSNQTSNQTSNTETTMNQPTNVNTDAVGDVGSNAVRQASTAVVPPAGAPQAADLPAPPRLLPDVVTVFGRGRAVRTTDASIDAQLAVAESVAQMLPGSALDTPQVQACFAPWNRCADALALNRKQSKALRMQLRNLAAQGRELEKAFRKYGQAFYATIDVAAAGNEQLLTGAGVPARQIVARAPKELLAPTGLTATPGRYAGEMTLDWRPVKGAHYYQAQMSFAPVTDASWQTLEQKTRRKRLLKGLPPGQQVWFRVAALGAAGTGPWSEPLAATVR